MPLEATEILKARGGTGQFDTRDAADEKTVFFPFYVINIHDLPGAKFLEFVKTTQARLIINMKGKTINPLCRGMVKIHVKA